MVARPVACRGMRLLDRGFSLVELLLTLAILAIAMALAAPGLRDFTGNQRASSATMELYTALMKARSEAVKRNAVVTLRKRCAGGVEVDWGQGGWALVSEVDDGDCDLDEVVDVGGVEVAERLDEFEGKSDLIVTEASDLPRVRYGSAGRVLGVLPQFRVEAGGGYVRCLSVELSGMPRILRKGEAGCV